MTDRASLHDTPAPSDEEAVGGAVAPSSDAGEVGGKGDEEKPFGEQEPTRFAADVEYRGRAGGHDYLIRVRHRLIDSSFTVVIDGVEHDPKAEEKAYKAAQKTAAQKTAERTTEIEAAGDAEEIPDARHEGAGVDDGAGTDDLRFRLEESFTVVRCTVRRRGEAGDHGDTDPDDTDPDDTDPNDMAPNDTEPHDTDREDTDLDDTDDQDGTDPLDDTDHRDGSDYKDAEVISVHTAGLGGAGEVDVRHGLDKTLLVPAADSPSAVRDEKRIAHPVKYAMLSALAKAAGFLIPLLGLSSLFSGLFDPIEEWVEARVRPLVDAISQVTEPVRTWFDELMRPVTEFFDALFAPIRSAIAAVLRPIGEAWNWLTDLLFGWIPDFSLPFSVPEWVVDAALPVIVVLVAFVVTFGSLRHRREKLDATRAASAPDDGATGRRKETRDDETTDDEPTDGETTGDEAQAADGDTASDAASNDDLEPELAVGTRRDQVDQVER